MTSRLTRADHLEEIDAARGRQSAHRTCRPPPCRHHLEEIDAARGRQSAPPMTTDHGDRGGKVTSTQNVQASPVQASS